MGVFLDTRQSHRTRQHGDIIATYTWVNDERAMILIPAYRKRDGWFVIMESRAWEYDDPVQLAESAVKACEVMGIEPSRGNWSKVAGIIHEGLPDLISMPSAPPKEKAKDTYGDLKVMADGQLIGGEELRLENEGVQYG